MPTRRDHLGVAVLEGRLHAVGGRTDGRDFRLTAHEVYDPASGRWSRAAPLPTGRSGHAVAATGRCLYALGGEGSTRQGGMFGEVERYDARAGTWTTLSPMPQARHGMGAVTLGARLLLSGGGVVAGLGPTAANEAFTPPPAEAPQPSSGSLTTLRVRPAR